MIRCRSTIIGELNGSRFELPFSGGLVFAKNGIDGETECDDLGSGILCAATRVGEDEADEEDADEEEEPARLWAELLDGRWLLVDDFDPDRGHVLVLAEPPHGEDRRLSNGERLVVQKTARGASSKEIAYDLKTSPSSIATRLRRGLKKLRVSRFRLRAVHAYLFAMPGRRVLTRDLQRRSERLKAVFIAAPECRTNLTSAERDVAMSAASGMSNRGIAAARGRSERTVANQLAPVFRKLGVTCRTELVAALSGKAWAK